ncbi:MAG: hypothetical protein AB7F99_15130 [Vicinamibacterales bacterium]
MRPLTFSSAAVAVLLVLSVLAAAPFSVAFAQNTKPADCAKWEECRQFAIDARTAADYGRFLDFAWRAVQRGPANNAELMYLLARAQALGGRSSDALVTLGRLAARGAGEDALSEPDFDRARRLPGWPEVEAALTRIAKARVPESSTAPSTASTAAAPAAPVPAAPARVTPPSSSAPAAPAAAAAAALAAPLPAVAVPPPAPAATSEPLVAAPPKPAEPVAPAATAPAASATPAVVTPSAAAPTPASALKFDQRPSEEVSRFSTAPFVASALAYDAVSRRFLFGDVQGRRVVVVGEGSTKADNLVLAATAQFNDVTAFEIDAKRGDLWVASTAPNGYVGAIHRLQLISGRAVAMIESPTEFERVRLIDLAVAASGALLVLDAESPRVIGYRPGAKSLEERMALELEAPTSITTPGDDRVAYVAHRTGIARLDLQQRTVAAVTAPNGVDLTGFERIRWHRNGLIGVQRLSDGSRRIVEMPLTRGRVVSDAAVIETGLAGGPGAVLATVTGDDMYYLVTEESESPVSGERMLSMVVKRMHLPAAGVP